jgi:hypothetical protein
MNILFDALYVFFVDLQTVEHYPAAADAGGHGLAYGLRLLHDLLEHEVGVAALFRGGDVPVDEGVLLFHRFAQGIEDLDGFLGDEGHLAVLHVGDLAGVLDDGGGVGRHKVAALAVTQKQGGVLAGGDEAAGIVAAQDDQRVGALDAVQHLEHGVHDVVGLEIVVLDELDDHLGIGLGLEHHALGDKEFLQLHIVFDYAVVHQRHLAVLAHVGVGVELVGHAVGGPAGVADAGEAVEIRAVMGLFTEIFYLSGGFDHFDLVFVDHRHAGGIVAPVFKLFQSVQQQRGRLFGACISDYSTHFVLSFRRILVLIVMGIFIAIIITYFRRFSIT